MTDLERIEKIAASLGRELKRINSFPPKSISSRKIYYKSKKNNIISLVIYGVKWVFDYSFLEEFTFIQELNLSYNGISDLSFIKKLKHLTHLDLSANQINDIIHLSELKSITYLDLSYNQINDISILSEFKFLRYLDLSNNKIDDIAELSNLKSLFELNLSENLISDISVLSELNMLFELNLNNNRISNFTNLAKLKCISSISLSDNEIIDIPELFSFNLLKMLDLSNNKISVIPELVVKSKLEISAYKTLRLSGVLVAGNPIQVPPLQIVKQGKNAMLNYFEQVKKQGGTETLSEAKIIIVGEAGAGKTTLYKKLQNPQSSVLPDTSSTLGVEIKEGHLINHTKEENIKIRANLWDFGGQEIQYQLHQFFITPDSLYILVADNRKQHTRWDYWFQIIKLLGGNCSVLTVLNNNSTYNTLPNFPIKQCKANFKELEIDQADIDFKVNDFKWDNLQKIISSKLSELPIVNKEVPRLWKPLRESLITERETNNYIYINKFFDLCPDGLDSEEDRLQALKYFHNIGIVMHFADDIKLRNTVLLNPNWITNALYAALDGSNKELENGMFTKEWIFGFWQNHKNNYNYEERTYLLRLMLKDNFDICYEVCEGHYIVPMLLPDGKPDYKWNYSDNLGFRIQYPFMPEGIISRLIVRLNDKIKENRVWKEGVLINDEKLNCNAQIIQKKDFKTGLMFIDIHVDGESLNNKKELLTIIRYEIYHIHKTSFSDIPYTELIICNCDYCMALDETQEPEYYRKEVFETFLARKKMTIQCQKSTEDVQIHKLLGRIYTDEEIEEIELNAERKKEINISISDSKNVKIVNESTEITQD